jgi:hypothetical protein
MTVVLRRETPEADGGRDGNAALPSHDWPNFEVEEIEGFKEERWARFGGQGGGGECTWAHRSRGGKGGSVSPLWRREREGEGMGQHRRSVATWGPCGLPGGATAGVRLPPRVHSLVRAYGRSATADSEDSKRRPTLVTDKGTLAPNIS